MKTEEYISEDMKLAVKRGAYWMDENYPGWATSIDLNQLNMLKCDRCIIGQAIGSYYTVVENAALAGGYSRNDWNDWCNDNGFDCEIDPDRELATVGNYREINRLQNIEFGKLETLWTEEVRKRLG